MKKNQTSKDSFITDFYCDAKIAYINVFFKCYYEINSAKPTVNVDLKWGPSNNFYSQYLTQTVSDISKYSII